MNICIFGAASNTIKQSYITIAEELGRTLSKKGYSLVFGGGAHGLMGAVARGFFYEGAKIIGVSPAFFNVDGALYDHCTKMILTDTMRQRKQLMDDMADAFIAMPGGIGTIEEFFEIFTLKQLGQSKKPLILFNIDGYFDPLIQMVNKCVTGNFMTEKTVDLCYFSNSITDVVNYLETYVPPNDINIYETRNITPNPYN